tara:strand:- start:1165 stop:1533 length:369 start_codon:yes stop_codon:yes gene_type:complete
MIDKMIIVSNRYWLLGCADEIFGCVSKIQHLFLALMLTKVIRFDQKSQFLIFLIPLISWGLPQRALQRCQLRPHPNVAQALAHFPSQFKNTALQWFYLRILFDALFFKLLFNLFLLPMYFDL